MKLQQSQVAVIRTDTLYGLVTKAGDREAVEKVYELKGRDFTKPCIVLVASKEEIGQYGTVVEEISAQYSGAVTIVVPKTIEPDWVTRGGSTAAYRIPKDETLQILLRETGPLIAPSANLEGQPPARNIEEAKRYFGDKVDYYIDGGEVPETTQPSKIIEVLESGETKELRG
jgi:L-threonylcarbamoyladenylate synthase